MFSTDVIVIGGGQAGLAVSRSLQIQGIDHIVLERGSVAQRWRTERWESLRLLTPNWMTRLPDWQYNGSDPDGYMPRNSVVDFLSSYVDHINAPIICGTTVNRVSQTSGRYSVSTNRGTFKSRCVVIATGYCDIGNVPDFADNLPDNIYSIPSNMYRNTDSLPNGGVVIVGASATGLQLADEIQASGRQVTICVGSHIPMPRTYRGKDIMFWLDQVGILDVKWNEVRDINHSRRQPSFQLVGRQDRRDMSLKSLSEAGVRVVGRALDAGRSGMRLATDLSLNVAKAEKKMTSVIERIDEHIAVNPTSNMQDGEKNKSVELNSSCNRIDFTSDDISTFIWATGYRRDYKWLDVPILDKAGEIQHQGGLTPAPGLCVMGLNFMRKRNSSFIDGVGDDAKHIAANLKWYLNDTAQHAA